MKAEAYALRVCTRTVNPEMDAPMGLLPVLPSSGRLFAVAVPMRLAAAARVLKAAGVMWIT